MCDGENNSVLERLCRIVESVRAARDARGVLEAAEEQMRTVLALTEWRFEAGPELGALIEPAESAPTVRPAGQASEAATAMVRLREPLVCRGRRLGWLHLGRDGRCGQWTASERLLVSVAAAVVADALKLALWHHERERYRRAERECDLQRQELGHRLTELRQAYSELERVQSQLVQTEKMASIGLLASSLAHELDSPLSTILLTTEMTMSGSDAMEVSAALRVIGAEAGRCRDIIRNLLDFARQSPARWTREHLAELLAEVLRLMHHALRVKHVEVANELPAELPPVRVVANQVQQVFFNLISNAIDAMPNGGRIKIRAEEERPRGLVRVVMEDTGTGFEPATLPRVFDAFFTTKEPGKGTGLGLSICQGIVRAHGGSIRVGNGPNGGAQVIIELPVDGPAGRGDSA
mgnify:CR=1 FL=1